MQIKLNKDEHLYGPNAVLYIPDWCIELDCTFGIRKSDEKPCLPNQKLYYFLDEVRIYKLKARYEYEIKTNRS